MPEPQGSESLGNTVTLYQGGSSYFEALFTRINEAHSFIHIQVYILANDQTGNRLLQALFEAAERGIKVFLMLDAFGCSWVRAEHFQAWKEKGLQIKLFSRRLRIQRLVLGRRQHSKIVVIDNEWMSVGGLNIADRYSGFDGALPWLDIACWVYGPAAKLLNGRCAVYWPRKIRRQLRNQPGLPAQKEGITLRILMNDWLRNRFEVRSAYRQAFEGAEEEILLIAAYFFPSPSMLRLLSEKAKAGVKVRLVFSAVSDVPFMKPAMEYFYNRLLGAGAEIFEWRESILHAKVAIVDHSWLTIGSYNLNQLSDYGSLETNISVENRELTANLLNQLEGEVYPKIRKIEAGHSTWFMLFKRYISYLALRFSLNLLFLTNRHKR